MSKCVHTEHCCIKHGCKYGDENCPVELGIKQQSYDCESCGIDFEMAEDLVEDITYWNSLLLKLGYKIMEVEC